MTQYTNYVTITNVGRLVVRYVEKSFREGSWNHNVILNIEKTNPGLFSTHISMKLSWTGNKENEDAFTKDAKRWLSSVGAI